MPETYVFLFVGKNVCAVGLVPDIALAYQQRMKTADLSTGEEVAIFEALQAQIRDAGIGFSSD